MIALAANMLPAFCTQSLDKFGTVHAGIIHTICVSRAESNVTRVIEDATNHGRIDMAVKLPERIFLFEFKVVELLPEGQALQQLKDKAYADKYRRSGLPVVLVGVEFSRTKRNVVRFETEAG